MAMGFAIDTGTPFFVTERGFRIFATAVSIGLFKAVSLKMILNSRGKFHGHR